MFVEVILKCNRDSFFCDTLYSMNVTGSNYMQLKTKLIQIVFIVQHG